MATKKPATKKVATAKKTTSSKTATKKTAPKKTAPKKDNGNVLFSVRGVGDEISLQVEGNGERLVSAIASAISDEPSLKALLRMAVMVA